MALLPLFLSPGSASGHPLHYGGDLLGEMRKIEFTQINYDEEAKPYYGYIKGTIPILISAPHGAKHYRTREMRWKDEDAYTSSLAIVLGRLTGAHVLYVKNKADEDPNNDTGTRYKAFLKKIVEENGIKFVADLHGAGPGHGFRVDVGVMDTATEKSSCPTFKGVIEGAFIDFGPAIFNQRFTARGDGTVTCFARRVLGIEAAQIEINARYRIVESKSSGFRAREADVLTLVERLQSMILSINKRIAEGLTQSGTPQSETGNPLTPSVPEAPVPPYVKKPATV